MSKRILFSLLAVAVVAGGTVAVAQAATKDNSKKVNCVAKPEVSETRNAQKFTVVCTVPKPKAATATVTTTATTTVTVSPSPSHSPSASQTPTPSTPPSSTSNPSPTSPATPTSPAPTTPTDPPPTTPTSTPTGNPGAFPDASNTGVPAGTSLTAYTGPSTISTPNTVIDGKTMGCISVTAPGVVIRNSKISCRPSGAVVASYDGEYTGTPLLLEDVEIDCKNNPGHAIGDANVTVRRADISGCENGFDMNQNILIEDSYIHDLWDGPGAHSDGIQLAAGHWTGSGYADGALNITIRHNTIYGVGFNGDLGTSAIISNPVGDHNVLIQDNLLAGGAYTLYCAYEGKASNYRVIGNHFSRKFAQKYGAYGPSDGCSDETLSGNVDHDTGNPVKLD